MLLSTFGILGGVQVSGVAVGLTIGIVAVGVDVADVVTGVGDLDVGVDIMSGVEVVTGRRVMSVAVEKGVSCAQIRGNVTSSSKFE